ncbi:MAG: Isomerizing Glutamine-fructose-6-phosphate aminotransferase [Candidatus Azambacteria bacterium GW2011_GWA2_39_10]|uniref:Glutamine--fructose-6-phosphate aminotransferase [isomerizing] n=1 Tax=Candidatus Azambacteria bacterium GW2011_GWA2_39_10 TaxID=1618611 RepID=A0A0G0PP74_9BACT|nr:MAG: Isomerizing Glutamine-fructose-6-phosphate aminotransferase [Candidatus Azambacteria bacterium GW2011_GWA2_39_10]
MCGIIGYVGKSNALPILINGLKRLEYRGYDSAGVDGRRMASQMSKMLILMLIVPERYLSAIMVLLKIIGS